MKKVKEFIENFGKDEYISNVRALDSSITEEIYEKTHEIPAFKYFLKGGKTIPYKVNLLLEEGDSLEEIKLWQEAYYERFLFQIIEYRNPKFGKELQFFFPDINTVYRCIVSDHVKTAISKLSISDSYSVINTDGGLKIIYQDSFDINLGKFITPHDGTHLHILDFGEIISVKNYIVPEEEVSLKIFNKNS